MKVQKYNHGKCPFFDEKIHLEFAKCTRTCTGISPYGDTGRDGVCRRVSSSSVGRSVNRSARPGTPSACPQLQRAGQRGGTQSVVRSGAVDPERARARECAERDSKEPRPSRESGPATVRAIRDSARESVCG